MSLAYTNLKPVKLVDPRANLHEATEFLFRQPANKVTHRTVTASSSSNSSVTFKATPPNSDTVMSRLVYLTMKVTAKITCIQNQNDGTVVNVDAIPFICGTDLNDGGNPDAICLRQFPLASVMQAVKMSINSHQETEQPYKYIHALSRFCLDDDMRAYEMGSSPSQPDFYQKYADRSSFKTYTVNAAGDAVAEVPGSQGKSYGEGRSPFASYGGNSSEMTRGSYRVTNAVNVGAVTTVTWEITEPLFLSPLSGGNYNSMGINQITGLDFDIQWNSGKLERVLSIDEAQINTGGGTLANSRRITGVEVSMGTAADCKMSFIYFTVQPDRALPKSLVYDFHRKQHFTTEFGAASSITPATPKTSQNIQLSTIPAKMYIWVQQSEQDRDKYSTDTFARIDKISLQFNNDSGQLSSAESWDLWRMSVDNGLRMSFAEWKFYTGSVLCIDFGKNLGLGPNQCVGLLGNFNFQFDITWKALDSRVKNYDLNILADYSGTFTIENGNVQAQIGIVSQSDVLEGEDFKEVNSEFVEKMYGGNFLTGIKSVYNTIKPYAKKGVKLGKELAPVLETIAPRAAPALNKGLDFAEELLGQGYSKPEIARMKRMGYTQKDYQKLLGGNLVGGARCPKNRLKQRAQTYV